MLTLSCAFYQTTVQGVGSWLSRFLGDREGVPVVLYGAAAPKKKPSVDDQFPRAPPVLFAKLSLQNFCEPAREILALALFAGEIDCVYCHATNRGSKGQLYRRVCHVVLWFFVGWTVGILPLGKAFLKPTIII